MTSCGVSGCPVSVRLILSTVALSLWLSSSSLNVDAYASRVACSRSLTSGNMMNMGISVSVSQQIKLARGGSVINCGGTLTPNEQGLTLSKSSTGSQYVIEAEMSAGTGSWGIISGSCSMQRTLTTSRTFTAPPSGTVKLRVASAGGYSTVTTSADCTYTVVSTPTCGNCLAGTYRPSSATTCDCTACPADSTSPAGSTTATQCSCNSGYGGSNGGTCTKCDIHATWEASTSSATCKCNKGNLSRSIPPCACECHPLFERMCPRRYTYTW